jgi:hypothetical protein
MTQFLEKKLYTDVEGTCSGQYGYIIAVVNILELGKGLVLSGNGQAEFVCRYRAIVFKPFKGEVLDGVVSNVMKVRLLICSSSSFGTDWSLSSSARLLRGSRTRAGIRIGAGTFHLGTMDIYETEPGFYSACSSLLGIRREREPPMFLIRGPSNDASSFSEPY